MFEAHFSTTELLTVQGRAGAAAAAAAAAAEDEEGGRRKKGTL